MQTSENTTRISRSLKEVRFELSKRLFASLNSDLVIRPVETCMAQKFLLVFIDGMANAEMTDEFILKPLCGTNHSIFSLRELSESVVPVGETKLVSDYDKAVDAVLGGMSALFLEGMEECLLLGTHGFEKRSVSEANNEQVVLGPKESFNESIKTNAVLIRRCIRSSRLIVNRRPVNTQNGSEAALIYMQGEADERVVTELNARLDMIRSNVLLTSGIAEQILIGNSLCPIPRTLITERPDRAASHILNGRICLLIEGSPEAVILPITLFSLLNSPEDVYMNRALGTLLRVVRYLGILVSMLMPGYFLALALYHQGLLSTEVLSTVVASRRMVFEPIAVELILLLTIFQLIREAGQRVPGSIGQAIGIIGGLIMGQAAVTAHLASSVVLIIVAASGLGNFCIPDYRTQLAVSYFRLAAVLAAWAAGLLGLAALSLLCIAALADMKSFGMPFLAPYSPKLPSQRPFVVRGRITNSPNRLWRSRSL